MRLERTKASQRLTSSSSMAPSQFLFQEHLGDLFRRELRLRNRWVPALDQGPGNGLPPHPGAAPAGCRSHLRRFPRLSISMSLPLKDRFLPGPGPPVWFLNLRSPAPMRAPQPPGQLPKTSTAPQANGAGSDPKPLPSLPPPRHSGERGPASVQCPAYHQPGERRFPHPHKRRAAHPPTFPRAH